MPNSHDSPKYFFLFVATYLLDEIGNSKIGVGLTVPLLIIMLGVLNCRSFFSSGMPLGKSRYVLLFIVLSAYQVFSVALAPADCTADSKFLTSLLIALFLAWSLVWVRPDQVLISERGSRWLLYAMTGALLLAWSGLDVMTLTGTDTRIKSGFYLEPSHLALHILPLIAYRLLTNARDKLAIGATMVAFCIVPSATLAVGVMAIAGLLFYMKTRSLLLRLGLPLLALAFVSVASAQVGVNPILDRISGVIHYDPNAITNLSSVVWLNGWSQAYDHWMQSYGAGVGINQMGCGALEAAGFMAPWMRVNVGAYLNYNDGSFLIAKVVSEFGVVGLFASLLFTLKAVMSLFNLIGLSQSNATISELKLSRAVSCASGGIVLLVLMYVRNTSYFSFPVILCVCLLLRSEGAWMRKRLNI